MHQKMSSVKVAPLVLYTGYILSIVKIKIEIEKERERVSERERRREREKER